MLVLSRKLGESIDLYLGGEFLGTFTVLEISSGRVRLSIVADQNLRVVRSELTDGELVLPERRMLEHA